MQSNAIRLSRDFESFLDLVDEITTLDVHTLKHEEATAFFLNIYTCLLFHACVHLGPPESLIKSTKFYNRAAYIIGRNSMCLSLQDIMNGILLGNRKAPKCFFPRFPDQDERKFYALKKVDYRIVFVLRSALYSSVCIYRAEMVDSQIEGVVHDHFNDSRVIDINLEANEATLPCEVDLYANYLGDNEGEAIGWCIKYLTETRYDKFKKMQVKEMLYF
jgi:hypothetical protein